MEIQKQLLYLLSNKFYSITIPLKYTLTFPINKFINNHLWKKLTTA